MKRMVSRTSHSWWLDENLEEMDRLVREMLNLIEEGDAEMYCKRRPELVSHVENFYRLHRALAERYDHVTGELCKNIPSVKALETMNRTWLPGRMEAVDEEGHPSRVAELEAELAAVNKKLLGSQEVIELLREDLDEMDAQLHQLHLERVKLIAEAEDATRESKVMHERVRFLKEEVERQHEVIWDGDEKKREAIRQLCFSLEHYRDGYNQLRQVLLNHRRLPTVLFT